MRRIYQAITVGSHLVANPIVVLAQKELEGLSRILFV